MLFTIMKKLFYILVLVSFLVSCNDFQKAMKSEDTALKFQLGTELFDAGKYSKANRLFEQIVPKYRGKPQAEKLIYMHAMCFYKMEQYYLSGYKFEQFVNSYPKSEKAEEAAFLAVKSYYEESPIYSKDKEETIKALEKAQLFININPDSPYLAEANALVKELDYKLEKKDFEIAKQYNHTFQYLPSVKAFNNFLLDYPGSVFKEDALYWRFVAEFNLAINSIEQKKEQRIEQGLKYFEALQIAFPESEFLKDAQKKKDQLLALTDDDADTLITKS